MCESQRISIRVMCERIRRTELKAQEEIRRLRMLTPGSQLDHATLRLAMRRHIQCILDEYIHVLTHYILHEVNNYM